MRYKKPTNTRVVLKFRCCAPIQPKKNFVEGTVHRVFRSTSTRQNFDIALKETENVWLRNQYPESWTSKIINDALQKIVSTPQLKNEGEKVHMRGHKLPAKDVEPFFFLQYRGNISLLLKQKLEKTFNLTAIFTTRKLCTRLPSLKSSFDSNLSLMWSTNSVVVNAVPNMSDKGVDIWPGKSLSIKKPTHRWDNM